MTIPRAMLLLLCCFGITNTADSTGEEGAEEGDPSCNTSDRDLGWHTPPPSILLAPEPIDVDDLSNGRRLAERLDRDGFAYFRVAGGPLEGGALVAALASLGAPYSARAPIMVIDYRAERPYPQIALTRMGLEFHHEVAYDWQPPRHLALHCRRNRGRARRGGHVLICDADAVVAGFPAALVEGLRATPFVNTIRPQRAPMPLVRHVKVGAGKQGRLRRLEGGGGPAADAKELEADDESEERFIISTIGGAKGHSYFRPARGHKEAGHAIMRDVVPRLLACPGALRVEWHEGDLLVLDNLRFMHARTPLDASAADAERNITHFRIA